MRKAKYTPNKDTLTGNDNNRLLELRTAKKWTQEETKKILENHGVYIDIKTYRKYERGEVYPSGECLVILSRVYGVSIDYLLGYSDYESIDNADISAKTGLTEKSIKNIKHLNEMDNNGKYERKKAYYMPLLNKILSSKDFSKLLYELGQVLDPAYTVPVRKTKNGYKPLSNDERVIHFANGKDPEDIADFYYDSDLLRKISMQSIIKYLLDMTK